MRNPFHALKQRIKHFRHLNSALADCHERFQALVVASSDIVYRMNADWTQMRQLHGREVIDDTRDPNLTWMTQYIPAEEQERVGASIRIAIESKSTFLLEHKVIRADQTIGWVKSRAIPVTNAAGNITEWFGIACDISEDVEARSAQEKKCKNLAQDNRQKDEFLAALSHELRNPLMPINNCLEILESSGMVADPAKNAVTIMRRQLDHLRRLIDDLLDLNRVAQNKIQVVRKSLDLLKLVGEVVENHLQLFQDAGIRLSLLAETDRARVFGDEHRLMQVMGNLLSNAYKFTPSGQRVCVRVVRASNETLEIHVIDGGGGIGPEVEKNIFTPFFQVKNSAYRNRGGLGLGLPLSLNIVQLHGGTIVTNRDKDSQGAHFIVRLPLDERESIAIRTSQGNVEKHRRRILIIEDNIDAAHTLRQILEADGHSVEVAHDGAEGLRQGRLCKPDVVVCDIGLPDLSGHKVVETLRKALADATVFIALTGYGLSSDVERAHQSGFDYHEKKPPNLTRLRHIINKPAGEFAVTV